MHIYYLNVVHAKNIWIKSKLQNSRKKHYVVTQPLESSNDHFCLYKN